MATLTNNFNSAILALPVSIRNLTIDGIEVFKNHGFLEASLGGLGGLDYNKNIKSLTISNCGLKITDLTNLTRFLERLPSNITELDLSNNNLHIFSEDDLIATFKKLPLTVTTLNLSGNQLSPMVIAEIDKNIEQNISRQFLKGEKGLAMLAGRSLVKNWSQQGTLPPAITTKLPPEVIDNYVSPQANKGLIVDSASPLFAETSPPSQQLSP